MKRIINNTSKERMWLFVILKLFFSSSLNCVKVSFILLVNLYFGLSIHAQTSIEELSASNIAVSSNKTFHLIFPSEVKYFSIGDENVAGEKIKDYPCCIRIKSVVPMFIGKTNMSVVTADGQYYSYNISCSDTLKYSYLIVGKQYKDSPFIAVNDKQQTHLIFPARIVYVDYGTTDVEVIKASGVDNIIAIRASKKFQNDTNVSVVTSSGKFYAFNIHYENYPQHFSFVVDPVASEVEKRIALLDNKEMNSVQREDLRKEINSRLQSITKLSKDYAGIRFAVNNIFIYKDILLFKFKITNYSNIYYQPDFVRFYIQDKKVHKKTAVQQIEQVPLFFFDLPKSVPAHTSQSFSVALNKFTIPSKKRLIIEMQEASGGRNFSFKVDNNYIISAEILNSSNKGTRRFPKNVFY